MKKSIIYLSALLVIILLSTSCKKHKYEKELIGKWEAPITPCDTNGFCTVIIEFKKKDLAYLNYCGLKGSKWNTPCKCKWWIDKKSATFFSNKEWLLCIERYDTSCSACASSGYKMPDTQQYIIGELNDNSMEIHWVENGNMGDLFFSESTGSVWSFNLSYEKTLFKQ